VTSMHKEMRAFTGRNVCRDDITNNCLN